MRALHSIRPTLARHARFALAALILCSCSRIAQLTTPQPQPPTAFVPQRGAGVQTLYRNGSAYAALQNPRGPVLVTLQPVVLSDRPFVRLWLHVQNRQVHAFRIDPDDIYLERRARGSGEMELMEVETEKVLARLEPQDRARVERGALVETKMVPPGESLQGAVYFRSPAPKHADAAYAYDLTLHLPTPDGPKRIVLRPVPAKT